MTTLAEELEHLVPSTLAGLIPDDADARPFLYEGWEPTARAPLTFGELSECLFVFAAGGAHVVAICLPNGTDMAAVLLQCANVRTHG